MGRRRALHLASFDYANAETARALARIAQEGGAEERLGRDPMRRTSKQRFLAKGGQEADLEGCEVAGEQVTFTARGLVRKLVLGLEAVRARHAAAPAERFATDYRGMAAEMIAAGSAAESCLRWYLEDQVRQVTEVMFLSITTGHRLYLGFLERTMPSTGEARAAQAVRLCRAMGVIEASAEEADAEGLTPLIRAAADGAGARVLRSLVAARANLEARDQGTFQAPAVWWAAVMGHADAVTVLGRLGADLNVVALPGQDSTPLYQAADEGYTDVVEALGQLGADVHRADVNGTTPLHTAASRGHAAVIEALARFGADLNRTNRYGWTPLALARGRGRIEAAAALERLGAR